MALVKVGFRLVVNTDFVTSIQWDYEPTPHITIRMSDGGEFGVEHQQRVGDGKEDCHQIVEALMKGSKP